MLLPLPDKLEQISDMTRDCFFSCDWGTTHFRLRLVDKASLQILGQHLSNEGVSTFSSRLQPGERPAAFEAYLLRQIETLQKEHQAEASSCVVSGMASSRIGWKELPYAPLPQALDGSGLIRHSLDLHTDPQLIKVILVSGLCGKDDVMRGEEVEVIGLSSIHPAWAGSKESFMVVLPGTHSKHIEIRHGGVHDFHTVMTGELFSHLQQMPTLKMSFPEKAETSMEAFRLGVRESKSEGALGALFKIRARNLLGNPEQDHAGAYLSGLLIAEELLRLDSKFQGEIFIAAEGLLHDLYTEAVLSLGFSRMQIMAQGSLQRGLLAGHRLVLGTTHS